MPRERRLQVFISSTFLDLKAERQAAVSAILQMGHIPAGMELFAAGDESQMTVIKRWIDDSDVFLLILGGRYGSLDPKSGKSYTHLEFDYAKQSEKPYFTLVVDNATLDALPKDRSEMKEPKLYHSFRNEVMDGLVAQWSDLKDIELGVHRSLDEISRRDGLVGWVRGNSAPSIAVTEELARLSAENEHLKKGQPAPESFLGLSYEAMKSMLVNEQVRKPNALDPATSGNGALFVKKVFEVAARQNQPANLLTVFIAACSPEINPERRYLGIDRLQRIGLVDTSGGYITFPSLTGYAFSNRLRAEGLIEI